MCCPVLSPLPLLLQPFRKRPVITAAMWQWRRKEERPCPALGRGDAEGQLQRGAGEFMTLKAGEAQNQNSAVNLRTKKHIRSLQKA